MDISLDHIIASLSVMNIGVLSLYIKEEQQKTSSKETMNQKSWKRNLWCIDFNTQSPSHDTYIA